MGEGGILTTPGRGVPAQDVAPLLAPVPRGVLAALPGVSLGIAGIFHPEHLNHATSGTWWGLHVAGLFAFPLVGVALIALFRGRRDPVAAVAVVAAFVYATAYTALDVINGIGAGFVTSRLGPSTPRPDEVRSLFAIGGPIGEVGSYALVVAVLVVALDALRRQQAQALPGLLMLPGALLVHLDHIFFPWGALGITLVGLGTGWLEARRQPLEVT